MLLVLGADELADCIGTTSQLAGFRHDILLYSQGYRQISLQTLFLLYLLTPNYVTIRTFLTVITDTSKPSDSSNFHEVGVYIITSI